MARFLHEHEKDNVAIAIEPAKVGDLIEFSDGGSVKAIDEIEFAHKVAFSSIAKGDKIFKYGEVIGVATQDISKGEHVHVHNIRTARDKGQEVE